MKIKIDFVTNSSSCSFIFLGFEKKKKDIQIIDLIKKIYPKEKISMNSTDKELFEILYNLRKNENIIVLTDTEEGAISDDSFLIGYKLFEYNDEDEMGVEFLHLIINLKKLKKEFNVKNSIKIYGLIRCC